MAGENKNGLVYDPNDPNYKIKPGEEQAVTTSAEIQDGLVYDPNDPNYKIKPAAAMPLSTTGQQPASTPVVADGQQATATVTTGQEQQPASTPVANQPQQATTPNVNPAENSGTGEIGQDGYLVEAKPDAANQPQQANPAYLTDWSKEKNVYEAAKKLNLPLAQVLSDYQRWGRETGNPTDWIGAVFQDADLSKSAAENEELKKKQERKEKWDKVGNFLLHLGNVIGNVAGGGMGAVQLEDPVKYTERQRMLKEKTEALRRNTNQSIWTQMQKDAAARRDYELKKKNAEALAAYRQGQAEAAIQRANSTSQVNDAKVKWYNAKTGAIEEITPKQLKEIQSRIDKNEKQGNASMIKAVKYSGGKTNGDTDIIVKKEFTRDRRGRVISQKEEKIKKPSGTTKGKKPTGIKNWVSRNKKQ